MLSRLLASTLLAVLVPAFAGCKSPSSARYIYQDGEFGVIGIPQNSPYGGKDFRKQAEELMAMHFPEGHEIVRAEEVVEGQRVLDKSRMYAIETDPTISAFNQKINLGKIAQTNSTQQKDSLPILESRIIYRRKTKEVPVGYTSVASLMPELYLDPNEMARCREKIELAELHKTKTTTATVIEKTKDSLTKQASVETTVKD
ncbi:hypothetical protein EP7_002859 [Isosphaeraceae bacterium EP7]